MARRKKSTRRRKGKRSPGKAFEGMAALVLLLVILTFGLSIASRFSDRDNSPEIPISGPPTELSQPMDPPDAPIPAPSFGNEFPVDRIAVVIENGCGVDGLARNFATELRGERFDVLDYRDADGYDYAETVILAHSDDHEAAREVFLHLWDRYQVGKIQLGDERVSGGDVRVVLGTDLADRMTREGSEP